MITTVSSAKRTVSIGPEYPTAIIGERINPTGRARMLEALMAGNLQWLAEEAQAQESEGAAIIDVNVGAPKLDEVALLPEAVRVVAGATSLPLCIDSSNPYALEAALKVYEGKALVNSVTAEEKSLSTVLPTVKKYGAAVIGMCCGESGIPKDPATRISYARLIMERAAKEGIPECDVLIDPLTLTVGAESQAGVVTLATARAISQELGVNMTMGASNISFGLPNRHHINNAFLAMVIQFGVTAPIVNPGAKDLVDTILAVDLLMGRDRYARRYLANYRKKAKSK